MDLCIRKGTMNDIDELSKLYDDINDFLAENTNYPGWKKGIYPTGADAAEGIREDSLFVAVKDNSIVGSLILRNKPEEGYYKASWKKNYPIIRSLLYIPLLFILIFQSKGLVRKCWSLQRALAGSRKWSP